MAQRDEYDAVVIGTGLGGLAAGAALARAGLRLLVLERHEGPGGYGHAFKRDGFVMDPGLHMLGDPSLFRALLEHVDVGDRCEFIAPESLYTVVVGDVAVTPPLGSIEGFVQAHVDVVPEAEDEIRRFFDIAARIHSEAHELPQAMSLRGVEAAMEAAPTYFKYRRRTLGYVLEECFSNPLAAALCGGDSFVLALPPSRLPMIIFGQYLFSYLRDSAFYVRGGAQEYADAMVEGIRKQGSDVLLGTSAERITVEDGRVVGVELAGGVSVRTGIVVSNAAAPHTFLDLVGEEHLPDRFLRRLAALRTSASASMSLGATTADVGRHGLSHTVVVWQTPDLEEDFRMTFEGEDVRVAAAFFPSLVDDSLTPGEENVYTTVSYRPYDIGSSWTDEQPRVRELVFDQIDAVLPGFRDGLMFSMDATPETLETFSGNTRGAAFGWDGTLDQLASKRPEQRTPIKGLYLAGHWTRPGAGSLRATVSGIHTSYMALDDSGLGDPEARFRHDHVPPAE